MALVADLTLDRGDTGKWEVDVSKAGAPLPLTGSVFRFYAKNRREDLDSAAVIKLDSAGLGGIIIVDAGNGIIRITLPSAQTLGLTVDTTLVYDLQITEPDGSVTTLIKGALAISLDVTQAF